MSNLLAPVLQKNDNQAKWLIGIFSVVVFIVIVALGRVQIEVDLGFDIHIFAAINAVINSLIAVLLVAALVAVKQRKYVLHKKMMLASLVLSILFLVSYIAHHLLAGSTTFGGQGIVRTVYYIILVTHIFLAGIILPFILFTAYRGLTSEFDKHRKLSKITWPLWFYVAVTGPIVYLMISPYYN